jgi:hypothetical protein
VGSDPGDLAKLVQLAELEASIEEDINPKKPQKPEETPVNGLRLASNRCARSQMTILPEKRVKMVRAFPH